MCIRDRCLGFLYELGQGHKLERRSGEVLADVADYAVEHGLVVRDEAGEVLLDGTDSKLSDRIQSRKRLGDINDLYLQMLDRDLLGPEVSYSDLEEAIEYPLDPMATLEDLAKQATKWVSGRED